MAAAAAPALMLAGCAPGGTDKASVERIVHDYILTHPEIVPQAMERLQRNKAATAIAASRAAIERPFAGAWAGAERPRVVLTMFTDYACGYCRASLPDIDRLLADTPDLKVVWREIPVLGPPSEAAARVALAAAQAGRYRAFHQALFAAGRPDAEGIAAAARAAGLDPARLGTAGAGPGIAREINGNLSLAARIGVSGTPTFVVGDTLLSGAVGHAALKAAVDAARGGASS